ncbi:MAG: transposase [Chloroflexi bacterium]|nr:transposase [Chloroflexota bacterium]
MQWFDYYASHKSNARLTCRHFGIAPQTFYRWLRRYDPRHLASLEDRSHRPKRVRKPSWTTEEVQAVLQMRQQYPRWGRDKLVVLLRQGGFHLSASMVGRILVYLKTRGVLKEPHLTYVSAGKRARNRPYAVRKPRDYHAKEAGELVQLDTLDLRPLPGVVFKHFTAHDVTCKWNVIGIYRQATAATARHFLDAIQERMPFPVKAIQVDGGSEFAAVFEAECQQRGIKLFVLPPRSPKLNGGVERAHRTHTEEFYEVTDSTFDLAELRQELLEWEHTYNTVRPHQSLQYLTPARYLTQKSEEVKCH